MEYKDFEQALKRLEEIVAELEKGELPLEKALKLFEEGVEISKICGTRLDEAERKVEILLKKEGGKIVEAPFEPIEESKES